MFDVVDHFDELRCWPTERLRARHEELLREQRRLYAEDLAVLRVLDEPGQVDDALAARDGVSTRTAWETLETARAVESLPALAAAAYEGALSAEQLSAVTKLADQDSDAEWARRAPNVAPGELARLARNAVKPSTEDSRARYAARSLRMWWTPDKGILHLHGQLPDVMGATLEATVKKLTEQMKPAKGQAWDSFEHRAADALVQLCEQPDTTDETPMVASRPVVQVHVPPHGPAEIAGIPIADSLLEQLRANATIEPVLVDDDGAPVAVGRRSPGLSPKIARAVLLRDGAAVAAVTARATTSTTFDHGRGVGPTTRRTWPRWRARAIPISSPMATSPWSAMPTCPGICERSTSTTSRPNNANRSASRHPEQDRRRDQRMASGFTGEPVPRGITSGATTNWNSQRPASAQATASSSKSALSRMGMPMYGIRM